MRTQDQIIERIENIENMEGDFFGFQHSDLVGFLDFEHAKPYLKDTATSENWKQDTDALAAMLDYMEFAWGKANDCRGLSAGRSLEHYEAWIWLAGDDVFFDQFKNSYSNNYEFYGKPQLRLVCEHYGWDWRQWDDGCWRNDEDSPCEPAPE